MFDTVIDILRWLALLGSAIMAGLFFAFSVFVLQSFTLLLPSQAISAMQSINTNITKPLFILVFVGTAIVSMLLGMSSVTRLDERSAVYALIGCVLFLLGTIVVTVAVNIPLNNQLDQLDPNAAISAADWQRFVDSWLPWNHSRTILNLAAVVSFVLAIRESVRN